MRQQLMCTAAVWLLIFPTIVLGQEAGTVQFQRAAIDPDTGSLVACSPAADPGLSTPPPEGICSSDPILVIDASLGNVVFPIPDAQRQFADINAFVNFAQNDLNATPIYDENGAPVGVKGRRFPQPERQDAAPST